jgi:hypothetical protein
LLQRKAASDFGKRINRFSIPSFVDAQRGMHTNHSRYVLPALRIDSELSAFVRTGQPLHRLEQIVKRELIVTVEIWKGEMGSGFEFMHRGTIAQFARDLETRRDKTFKCRKCREKERERERESANIKF